MSNRTSQRINMQGAVGAIDPNLSDVLEFGVWKGESLQFIVESLQEKYGGTTRHRVCGFDTFVGLPHSWIGKNGKFLAGPGAFNVGGITPHIPGVEFFVGEFQHSLPKYLPGAQDIALLHVDSDLYSSAIIVLEALESRIVENTIIVFDEWIYNHNLYFDDCEKKAFEEWVDRHDREFEFLDFIDRSSDSSGHIEQRTVRILK